MVQRINDSANFTRRVLQLVRDEKLEYMDAIMKYVEETGIEVEYAATLVKRCAPILQQLEAELVENRMLNVSPPISLTTFMTD